MTGNQDYRTGGGNNLDFSGGGSQYVQHASTTTPSPFLPFFPPNPSHPTTQTSTTQLTCFPIFPRAEFDGAMHHAQQHSTTGEDSSLFSTALSMLSGKKQEYANEDLDEQSAVQAHQSLYSDENDGRNPPPQQQQQQQQHSSATLGAGAAMQALKMFSGGGGGGQQPPQSQNAFIGLAMGQASKLFDQQSQQGKVESGADKQSVVNDAAKMALKMYLKGQAGGAGGGPGGLMGMAGKFL